MITVLAVAILICAASLALGRAALVLASGRGRTANLGLAPAIGLATLLALAVLGSRIADGAGAAIALALASVASLAFLRRGDGTGNALLAALVLLAGLVAAALPFLIAGHSGILGVALINDDMASHLQIAEHVRSPLAEAPRFAEGGYPIGPHAIVAGLAESLGVSIVDAFAALTIALAPLLALTLLAALDHLPPVRRVLAALVAALSYLSAAYIGQGAFKEPLEALIVIAFAIYVADLVGLGAKDAEPAVAGDRPAYWRAVPAGLLAAASVLNYSLPGLVWVAAVALAILALRYYVLGPRPQGLAVAWRRLLPYALGALAIVAVATASEWSRIAEFTSLDAFRPDRVGSDLGNLRQSISPAEALGVWPTGDFRTTASAAGPPAALFWLGGALALAALIGGLTVAWRSRRIALIGGLVATTAIWAAAAIVSTPYFAAKALAIGAPIAMALSLGWLLVPGSRMRTVLALALLAGATASSFLALRTSPVSPDAHAGELDRIRPHIEGAEVLFLGRDDFIGWELRGAEVDGVVKNHFNVGRVPLRYRNAKGGGDKFDIDAVTPKGLYRYDFVLAPRGEPRSDPGDLLPLIEQTPSYDFFALGQPEADIRRHTLDEGPAPGAILDCEHGIGERKRKAAGFAFAERPILVRPEGGGELIATDGSPASMRAELKPGVYEVSVAYDSRRPLRIDGTFINVVLPANLDFRGPGPLFPAARIRVGKPGSYDFVFSPEEPNWLAGILRAPNEAHIRALGFSPAGPREELPLRQACGRYVDYYVP